MSRFNLIFFLSSLLVLLKTPEVLAAAGGGKNSGGKEIAFETGFGTGGATIKNPDNSEANYKLLSVSARALLPLFDEKEFALHLAPGIRYLDLENSANSSDQSEVGSMIGPGAGVRLRAYKFIFGYEYHFMLARHYAVGKLSQTTKYEMPLSNLYLGVALPFEQISVSFVYSQSSGSVPKSQTDLSKNSPYSDHLYMLQVSFTTGVPLDKFLSFFF